MRVDVLGHNDVAENLEPAKHSPITVNRTKLGIAVLLDKKAVFSAYVRVTPIGEVV